MTLITYMKQTKTKSPRCDSINAGEYQDPVDDGHGSERGGEEADEAEQVVRGPLGDVCGDGRGGRRLVPALCHDPALHGPGLHAT